jgi:hypothetical protein
MDGGSSDDEKLYEHKLSRLDSEINRLTKRKTGIESSESPAEGDGQFHSSFEVKEDEGEVAASAEGAVEEEEEEKRAFPIPVPSISPRGGFTRPWEVLEPPIEEMRRGKIRSRKCVINITI